MTNQRGFTLIEMAIVLTLIGIILGAGIFSVSALVDRSHLIQTNTNLDQAEAALALFVVRNNRLPCPADGTIATGAANYGVEQVTTATSSVPQSCSVAISNSVLPWVTIGLDEGTSVDGWGRRLSYVPAGGQTTPAWNSLVDPGLAGSGASATATLTSNQITTINVISGGSGYTEASYTASFVLSGVNETKAAVSPTSGVIVSQIVSPIPSSVNYNSPPNVVFHTAGCMSRTSGVTNTGRSPLCDPSVSATVALDPSYPYGNYIAVYSILGSAYSTELTSPQPTASTTCNGATGSATIISSNVACAGGRAAYVLISHGTSGWYGWPKGGGNQFLPPSGAIPALKQYNNAATAGTAGNFGFVQGPPQGVLRNGPTANYFDDIVRWRTPALIIQLCGAGACGNP